uniref:SF3 helicase domain-containing protein n=1 Tax=viral metagenome TaxID=1070528 RepID=A0A6C0JMB7_9ZZZZ
MESSIIPTVTNYRDINDFLSKHYIQKGSDKPITNTRIGDKDNGIHGGSYHISDAEYPTFLKLYYRDVILTKKKEYLTEKQLSGNGPILVDIDFRHDYEVDERQYTKEHVEDLIDGYLEEIKKTFQLDENTKFPIFVLEKPSVNRLKEEKKTKDGIHMIIGLQADHIVQQLIRQKMLVRAQEMWSDFPKTNTWEDVFDAGISKGHVNWQLYGSRKPQNERYQLTRVFEIEFDPSDEEFMRSEIPIQQFNVEKNMEKLSVRYSNHISLFMKNDFVAKYEQFKTVNRIGQSSNSSHSSLSQSSLSSSSSATMTNAFQNLIHDNSALSRISNKEELNYLLNSFLDSVTESHTEYELKSTYEFVNILPPSYYDDGSYAKWIRVGWVLKNTSPKLLIVWLAFSAKAKNFQFSSIRELCEKWNGFDLRKHGGLTKLSLIHWAKTDAKQEYERVRRKTIDYYVEQTIKSCSAKKDSDRSGCGDFDLANVLYQLYKHEYVCVSVKANIWYQYKNNRWQEIDSGTTLRKSISIQLRDLYNQKTIGLMNTITTDDLADEEQQQQPIREQVQPTQAEEVGKPRSIRILNICQRLANTNDKKNIMTEAKELFYDGSFLAKLDNNQYLLCCKNGVIDFKEKIFRKGQPEDNISMSTCIDYIPLNLAIHQPMMNEINDFMDKLFPEKELCKYMWQHLASTLCGTSANQTFNMYIGVGSNGKSVLVDLMAKVLGDYKGDVPLTLVTDKRGKVGGLAPEIVQLKGKRYAVMQEPSKGDVINEGMMKQLTSGKDPLQGRAPYMPQTISFIPQFKLVVTCNTLMGVKANDHGTWRRIRAVPFKALFTETPIQGDKDKPYQFKLDKYIDEKFDEWKEVFLAMLVKVMFETNGVVTDCDIVMAKSNEYRQSQDYISEFIRDRVARDPAGRVKKMEVNNEFSIWYMANYGGRGPSPKDLHEYMDKEFGRQRNQIWTGVKIRYERDEVDENDDGSENMLDVGEVDDDDLV